MANKSTLPLRKAYGNTRFIGTFTDIFGADGSWSKTIIASVLHLPDGIYSASAFAPAPNSSNDATETIIVAQNSSPFEVIGLAFDDISILLASRPTAFSIGQDLNAEQAGLATLLQYGSLSAKADKGLDALLRDDRMEQQILTSSKSDNLVPRDIAKLDNLQVKMAQIVHDSPELLALMPNNVGWTSPVNPPTVTDATSTPNIPLLGSHMASFGSQGSQGHGGTSATHSVAVDSLIPLIAAHA
jgi:hypothetical protein